MREYFQWLPEQRPKIFGMTASPIWNPKDAVESLATLERNLDAKVIAVREHVEELADHSPRPNEARYSADLFLLQRHINIIFVRCFVNTLRRR